MIKNEKVLTNEQFVSSFLEEWIEKKIASKG